MYTFAELGNWVHLLAKRAENRNDFAKYDDDLQQASNYLSTMFVELGFMRDPMNLERFSDAIFDQLAAVNPNTRLLKGSTDNILFVGWKIPNGETPKTFKVMYDLYVQPNLVSLSDQLKNVNKVFVLEKGIPDMGMRVSIIQSDNMSARLTTFYDSDGGGGKNAGIVMSIEVGVAE